MSDIIIDKRFCGPKASANGGCAAGVLAKAVGGRALEVTLKSPPPLGEPISIRQADGGAYEAFHRETLIATIAPGSVSIDPPPLPRDADIAAAHDAYVRDGGMTLVYPYCFVCGKKRQGDDGLRIFAGAAPDSPVNADFWTPASGLADEDGLVGAEFLWGALDCPGAFALRMDDAFVLLGRFTAEITRRPAPGEKLIVAAWRTGQEGRKHFSASALYDENRTVIAAANAVWIELNDPAMLARLKAENA